MRKYTNVQVTYTSWRYARGVSESTIFWAPTASFVSEFQPTRLRAMTIKDILVGLATQDETDPLATSDLRWQHIMEPT